MTDRELMQMALDALEYDGILKHKQAAFALRERLSQPEPEPVAWQVTYLNDEGIPQISWFPHQVHPDSPLGKRPHTSTPLYTQPVDETAKCGREPDLDNKWKNVVIVFNDDPPSTGHDYDGKTLNRWSKDFDVYLDGIKGHIYTAPPKREWAELTDDEVKKIVDLNTEDDYGYDIWCNGRAVARDVESKLKEKNT